MDLIPFVQQVLVVVAIIFAIVLILSYVYTKFIKKEKEEAQPAKSATANNPVNSISAAKRKALNYTASSDAQKLYVNTDEHRKHVVTNKVVSKPKRFKVLNKNDADE